MPVTVGILSVSIEREVFEHPLSRACSSSIERHARAATATRQRGDRAAPIQYSSDSRGRVPRGHRLGSSDRITKRRRRLVCAAVGALTMTGCASVGDSPRAPYGLSPALEDTRNEIPAGLPFRIADASSWRQAMAARGESGFGEPALERGRLGLFDAADFRVARGDCADCGVSELIRWWFADELVAVPAGTPAGGAAVRRPQGIWIGAPSRVFSARLAAGGRRLESGGRGIELAIVPPLPTNTAYLDDSTLRYFAA